MDKRRTLESARRNKEEQEAERRVAETKAGRSKLSMAERKAALAKEIEEIRKLAFQEGFAEGERAGEQRGVERFREAIGSFGGAKISPDGKILTEAEWTHHSKDWLPTASDREFVLSLMTRAVTEPGKFAGWVAPPGRGIDGKPLDFEYVRFN